ncbi:hypothetical protein DYB28_002780 [Aphanomyces astaci]|uniref:HTH CENPB-type domain-containing protein n=1 Tax=Aphanomyces astaci TaxID=112090 RepID=A0A9X8DYI3_APHAT|nr:hypothetical protein DYB28_002780 [Aphanomyces astaci]
MRQLKLHVPLSILTVKATTIAKEIDISSDDFVASPGWMQKYRQRYNVKSITLYGEPADVDQTDPELLVKLDALADVVVGYNNSYVFNMDETELFFRVLPRYSLLALGEDMASKVGTNGATSNIRAAWENESSSTIKNAFAKADIGVNFSSNIVSSDDNVDDEVVELDVLAQNHGLETSDMNRFLHCDDRNSDEYIASIMAEMII